MSEDAKLAWKYFEMCSTEHYLDEALMVVFGATADDGETDPDTWPCTNIVYDPYDSSFELWGVDDAWVPTDEQLKAAFALGFAQAWFVCKDGHTQRFATAAGKLTEPYQSQIHRAGDRSYRERKRDAEIEQLKAQLLAGATPEGQRKESTLQRLTRCRAVLNMHGVLTKVENSNILLRIVGNYSEFLPAPPAPASGEKP